jgi:5-methyltetrahydrofolate--homocysteine methyltransferase
MAVRAGLDAAILDPTQGPVRDALVASQALVGGQTLTLDTCRSLDDSSRKCQVSGSDPIDLLLAGESSRLAQAVEKALAAGRPPREILDADLLPGMTEVGRRFKARTLFLPQVLMAAEAMAAAFKILEPRLREAGDPVGPLVILATVQGDVHDIGKNIVGAMLRAGGFQVRDLGKSVPAADIVKACKEHRPALVGLSALMTTTLPRMEEAVAALRREGLKVPVLLGGAVVTDAFARDLQAHYAPDAVRAVEVARTLAKI